MPPSHAGMTALAPASPPSASGPLASPVRMRAAPGHTRDALRAAPKACEEIRARVPSKCAQTFKQTRLTRKSSRCQTLRP